MPAFDDQPRQAAQRLNRQCFCLTLDRHELELSLTRQLHDDALAIPEAASLLSDTHAHLFSDTPVFVPREDILAMQRVVQAINRAALLSGYRRAALSWAPEIAGIDPGPVGAFMGYDFHLGETGPQLIEINTNAGGAFLNARLGRAQRACCGPAAQRGHTTAQLEAFDANVVRMFEREWQRQRGRGRPARLAIVDDRPESQYLYPEFLLAQALLEAHGIKTLIADPGELTYTQGQLYCDGAPVDLVYNRLVDFALEAPAHAALREAYRDGAVVVSPNPHVHALFADKRNLTLLSDAALLRDWGLEEPDIQALEHAVPPTRDVTEANADSLWQARRELFFKPATGHGSKGVYRGSKLTRGTFSQVLQGGYIAQAYVPPSERLINVDGTPVERKVDVRLYTYADEVLLVAARVYQGQATNFRTPGGGFAPVFQV